MEWRQQALLNARLLAAQAAKMVSDLERGMMDARDFRPALGQMQKTMGDMPEVQG